MQCHNNYKWAKKLKEVLQESCKAVTSSDAKSLTKDQYITAKTVCHTNDVKW